MGKIISVKLSFIRGFESQDYYYFFKKTMSNYVNVLMMYIQGGAKVGLQ